MSNEKKTETADPAALLQQLIAAGGIDLLRQLLAGGQTPGMPLHPDELAAAHAKIAADLERKHREHLARKNRAAEKPEPRVGNVFYVWLMKAVRGGVRTREGINFEPGKNVRVEVVSDDEATARARRAAGETVVTVDGMERVFEDDTLIVNTSPSAEAEQTTAAALERAAAAEARAAALERQLAEERAARQGAHHSDDGTPARLRAAQKAREDSGDKR